MNVKTSLNNAEENMKKAIDAVLREFAVVRTGRATPSSPLVQIIKSLEALAGGAPSSAKPAVENEPHSTQTIKARKTIPK